MIIYLQEKTCSNYRNKLVAPIFGPDVHMPDVGHDTVWIAADVTAATRSVSCHHRTMIRLLVHIPSRDYTHMNTYMYI
jgi:hypothetical protein